MVFFSFFPFEKLGFKLFIIMRRHVSMKNHHCSSLFLRSVFPALIKVEFILKKKKKK